MALFKDRASVSNELLFKLKHWPWVIISEQVAQLSLFTSPSCVVVLVLFHLENKPSQRSAEMLARFQSSHCLVLGVHLLTCSTNTLQILIKAKFSTCTLLPEILSHILERRISTQCLAHGLFWEVWPWMMNRLSYNYLHRLGVTYREVWPDLQFVITEAQKPSNLLTK